ncbi:hypothetical protein [Turneriella parva]|uniref:Uncharacterized protein n=1 Tax=Turneriella parva (strain ATCC BAA-1111 / DSM 21527 / NCTC 11395 / H) TaxID=869212 RepID=I4B3S0_TURPD|nr:hypothetical protein [Turneriella parva]AFM11927.1 hypothetical protein Turpa_1279 [Turneriella parva DSM 21527]
MKCSKQPAFLTNKPAKISNLWEVHLSQKLWQSLASLAKLRRCSYSTITRYCVFRLAEQQNLRCLALYTNVLNQIRDDMRQTPTKHRHVVCLYGEDEVLIRMAAMRLGITVSAFIRLALWLYLPRIAMEKHSLRSVSDYALFWRGIKRWAQIRCSAMNTLGIPTLRTYTFSNFKPQEWWPRAGLVHFMFPLAA